MKFSNIFPVVFAALLMVNGLPEATARSAFWGSPPDGSTACSACHGATTSCAGCHAHGAHPDSAKNSINVSATTDKAIYAPGETVTVSITGGYRPGWVRTKLWDQDCSVVGCLSDGAVVVNSNNCPSCPVGVGGDDGATNEFPGPVTMSFPAPAMPGIVTWSASWYGNDFDLSQIGGSTTFGPLWLPDPNNDPHGDEIVTFSFEVQGGGNIPPVAVDDLPGGVPIASTPVNTAVDVDVLANDTDDDGDTLTVNSFDNASSNGGNVNCSLSAISPTPQCTFTPAINVCGSDSFTYDATDGTDASNRATVTIQVGDANAPIVSAPADMTITLPAGSTGPVPATDPAIAAWLASATANDPEEGSLTVSNNAPADFPVGTTPVTFTATDSCGNSGAATANVIIQVADNNTPVVTAPAPLAVTAPLCATSLPRTEPQIAAWLGSATADDVEDGPLSVSNNAPLDFLIGDTLVTFTATDSLNATGSADSTLTVNETPNTAPTVNAPVPISITVAQGTTSVPATDPAIAAFLDSATANDTQDGALSVSNDAPASFPLGVTTVTFSATDACGLTTTATSTVTIQEEAGNIAPTLTVPDSITVTASLCATSVPATDAAIAAFLNGATANDAEDGDLTGSITNDAPTDFPATVSPGATTTVTFSVTDSGNPSGTPITTTGSSTVTAVDPNTAPTVNAPAPLTLTVAIGTTSVPATDPAIAAFLASATADDPQDGPLPVSNDAPAEFLLGTTTVTFTATDACGATATATSTVTIQEEVAVVVDLDIAQFRVTKGIRLARVKPIGIVLVVKNNGAFEGEAPATIVGVQNGMEVYNQTLTVSDAIGNGRTRFGFPSYTPTTAGDIMWTATIDDQDADIDMATATTSVQ